MLAGRMRNACSHMQATSILTIDPTADSVPGLNVLATDNPVLTADQLVGTFSRLYSSAWGPHLEQVLRQAFLTLAYGGGTLVELELLLTDESFRSKSSGQSGEKDLQERAGRLVKMLSHTLDGAE